MSFIQHVIDALRRRSSPKAQPDPETIAARTATIEAVYREELGRAPDADGLAHYLAWAASGATVEDIRADVRLSDEFLAHWRVEADAVYREVLARDATDEERERFLARFVDADISVLSPTMRALIAVELRAQRPPRPSPTLQAVLTIDGKSFREAGRVWKWHCASHFRMLRQWLDGVDQEPVYAWAWGLGVNIFRVFTMLSWARLYADSYTDERLRAFAVDVGHHGFRLELVALADSHILNLSLAGQRRHVARLADVLGDLPHVCFELANENTHPTNQIDAAAFVKPARGLWSRGSSHGDESAIVPPWDYGTDHSPRDGEWPRKAKNLLEWAELTGVPYVGDEPNKIRGTDLSPSDCGDYAAVADLFAAGSTIHTQSLGIEGRVPTGAEQAGAEAYAESWRSVPSDAQLGRYTRGGLSDIGIQHRDLPAVDGALRTFATITGSRQTVVVVRPGPAWQPVVINGWRVISIRNHVVTLER